MKHTGAPAGFPALAVLILLSVALAGCAQQPYSGGGGPAGQPAAHHAAGRAVFTIKGDAADMGELRGVLVKIANITAHSDGAGWVVVSNRSVTVDLLRLGATGREAVLADTGMASGTYDQVRMGISSVWVRDRRGYHRAALPPGDFTVSEPLRVAERSTSVATFGMAAGRALRASGDGYAMAPVSGVSFMENASLGVDGGGYVSSKSGSTSVDAEYGMDWSGSCARTGNAGAAD